MNYEVEMENKTQLEKIMVMLENKLTIKDDTENKIFYFDAKIDDKRIKTTSRYIRCSKDEAFTKIEQKKQGKIEELTLYFD